MYTSDKRGLVSLWANIQDKQVKLDLVHILHRVVNRFSVIFMLCTSKKTVSILYLLIQESSYLIHLILLIQTGSLYAVQEMKFDFKSPAKKIRNDLFYMWSSKKDNTNRLILSFQTHIPNLMNMLSQGWLEVNKKYYGNTLLNCLFQYSFQLNPS